MALEYRDVHHRSVSKSGMIHIRRIRIYDSGPKKGIRENWRMCIAPGDDYTDRIRGLDSGSLAFCSRYHTYRIVEDYKAKKAAETKEFHDIVLEPEGGTDP